MHLNTLIASCYGSSTAKNVVSSNLALVININNFMLETLAVQITFQIKYNVWDQK